MFAILSEDFPDGWVTWKPLGSLVSKYECKPRASHQVILEPISRFVPQIRLLLYYLRFEVHHSSQAFSYGSSLAANSKQSPWGGRPSGQAGVSYVSAVNVSLATWLLFPYRLITARGVKSLQGTDAARSGEVERELSMTTRPRIFEFIGKCASKMSNGARGSGLKVGTFRVFMISGGKPVRPH